jgi:quercetin dioxygenase-like cupin family protein
MLPSIAVVRRADIPLITEVIEDGELHELGELRDFRRHPLLAKFIPEQARLAIAWVRLAPNQELKPHRHPTPSLLLCTGGRGIILDQPEPIIEPGDAILVPVGSTHGFKGLPPTGVEGLSIQFEERGLYEDVADPLVKFEPSRSGQ